MSDEEKTCPKCAETIKAAAVICKHCGFNFETGQMPQVAAEPPKQSGHTARNGCLGIVAVVIVLSVLGSMVGGGEKAVTASAGGTQQPATHVDGVMAASLAAAGQPEAAGNSSSLTPPQQNAAKSAEQYLNMSGFSRNGLIRQLSSDAGEGYNKQDATIAVDSLDVDWNEQAARSAKQYLSMTAFSCNGLIKQLSSSAGEQFTVDQARYGAKAAGAC